MPLEALIQELVAGSLSRELPVLTRRDLELPCLPGKADVVTGMRRVGKTSLLFQAMGDRLAEGVDRERLLYFNFEDERLVRMRAEDLHLVPEALYRGRPSLRDAEVWLFLDELQVVPGWERFVRRLLDQGGVRVALTGSSAELLSGEIATSLRGRSLSTELWPFSFGEVLRHAGESVPESWPPAASARSRLEAFLGRYLEVGGFPEVQALAEGHRVRVLQDYLDVVLLRDVIERHQVANVPALRYLARRVVRHPSAAISVHRLYKDMKSQGLSVSKDTVYSLLDHLQDAHLLHLVALDARSERRRMANPRKSYLADHGLAVAHSLEAGRDLGHLLENAVQAELRRRGWSLTYLLTEEGYEVDFLARGSRGERRLVQVCADVSAEGAREREVRALAAAMRERKLDRAELVTLFQRDELELPEGKVRVVPAWQWLAQPDREDR